MEGLTLQIYNWLNELEEKDAADFISKCTIESVYQDTLFELGGDRSTDMFDVIIFMPLKLYKSLQEYGETTTKVESAIRESAQSQGIYVNRIEWNARLKSETEIQNDKRAERITELLSQSYVDKQMRLMHQSISHNPHLALGTAKELVETSCKSILTGRGVSYDRDWDIQKLAKETNKVIDLVPIIVDDKEIVRASVAKILSGFSNIIHGITELRNAYGTGHGHEPHFKMLDELYVKLAVTAAGEVAAFYLAVDKLQVKQSSS